MKYACRCRIARNVTDLLDELPIMWEVSQIQKERIKMKKWLSILVIMTLLMIFSGCSASKQADAGAPSPSAAAQSSNEATSATAYKDGTYNMESNTDGEGYFVKGTMVVKDSKITEFEAEILDSNRDNRVFDETYEEVMNTEHYKQQCRDDLKGLQIYNSKIIELQDPAEVDTISKATWAHRWFKLAAADLTKQAKQ